MSFKIQWPTFGADFIESAIQQLNVALNSGKKPDNIVGEIKVIQLFMGSKPPELEILEITELLNERFKGLFKLVYNGDAQITIKTHVQANPLSTPPVKRILNISQGMVLAHKPFVVPMRMDISHVQLRGVVVLVVDKEKGVTLVFKSDPLESVHVSSSFDNIPNIRNLLQRQIEEQLRMMFQEELPQMIHNLSLLFLKKHAGEDGSIDSGSSLPNILPSRNPADLIERDQTRIPHHKKWRNNDPVYSNMYEEDEASQTDGYVLNKTLSDGNTRYDQDLGLGKIFGSPRFNKDKSLTTTALQVPKHSHVQNLDQDQVDGTQGMASSPSGYISLGLRQQYLANQNYFMQHHQYQTYPFISQSEMSALDPDRDFSRAYSPQVDSFLGNNNMQDYAYSEINADDSVSNVSPSWRGYHDHTYGVSTDRRSQSRNQSHQAVLEQENRRNSVKSPISPPSSIHKGQVPDVLWHRPPPDSFNRPLSQRPTDIQRTAVGNSDGFFNQHKGNVIGSRQIGDLTRVVTLSPSDNEVTAHLANLMTSHLTISPNTQGLTNLTFRGAVGNGGGSGILNPSSLQSTHATISSSIPGSEMGNSNLVNGIVNETSSDVNFPSSGSMISSFSQRTSASAATGGVGRVSSRQRMKKRVQHLVQVPEILIRTTNERKN